MASVSRLIFLIFVGLFAFNVNAQSYPTQQDARNACLDRQLVLYQNASNYLDSPTRTNTEIFEIFDCSQVYVSGFPGYPYEYRSKVSSVHQVIRTDESLGDPAYKTYVSTTPGNTGNNVSQELAMDSIYGVALFRFAEEPENPCEDLNAFTTTTQRPPAFAQDVCISGCVYNTALEINIYSGVYGVDGKVPYTFTPTGNQCTSEPDPEPYDKPPSDTPDLDIEDYADAGPDPGDGETGASGGGSCDSPPQCKGDSLQCNMLYQTWATRCAVEGGEGGEGGEGEGLDGVIDGLEGLQGSIEGLKQDNRDAWDGEPGPGGDGDYSSLVGSITLSANDLDNSGLGFPRSCPFTQNPSFSLLGTDYSIDLLGTGICDILSWMGYLLVAFCSFLSVVVLLRGN